MLTLHLFKGVLLMKNTPTAPANVHSLVPIGFMKTESAISLVNQDVSAKEILSEMSGPISA